MQGLMMNMPLTITSILRFAEKAHANAEIVSVTGENPCHRYTYAEAFRRARQLANALMEFGIQQGDRIGTLAWNDYRHLELYYGVSCMGAVTHMINPRLFPGQLSYIINHAEDRILFVDPLVLPAVEKIRDELTKVEAFIILSDDAHMPEVSLAKAQSYESFIGEQPEVFEWPELEESTASSLCYTSGTTGNPKGVLYSHRSTIIHALVSVSAEAFNFSSREVVMPVVPMFHVNAWGIPYAAPIVGSKIVFPGPKMGDGETLQKLIEQEKVTFSAGVPTVWLALLNYLSASGKKVETLDRVIIGGSACPLAIMDDFEENYDVRVIHAWGMTEMSPLGTVNTLRASMDKLPKQEQARIKLKQGPGLFGLEMKIVDEDNNELPWDGKSSGILKVRAPWVCDAYYKPDEKSDAHDAEGWFSTGDIANIDAEGYLQLTDRSKDVIKSGGEWISSIDLENIAIGHPGIAEAAVIGVHHPKWAERPLLIVIKKPGDNVGKQEILDWLKDKVAKWWLPDDVVFVDNIPHTATGKILKVELRKQFKDYRLPEKI